MDGKKFVNDQLREKQKLEQEIETIRAESIKQRNANVMTEAEIGQLKSEVSLSFTKIILQK